VDVGCATQRHRSRCQRARLGREGAQRVIEGQEAGRARRRFIQALEAQVLVALRDRIARVGCNRERQGQEQQHGERRAREEVESDEADWRSRQRGEHPGRRRTNEHVVKRRSFGHRDDDCRCHDVDQREAQRGGECGAPRGHVVRRGPAEGLESDTGNRDRGQAIGHVEQHLERSRMLRNHVYGLRERECRRKPERTDHEETHHEHRVRGCERELVPVELERHVERSGDDERSGQRENRRR